MNLVKTNYEVKIEGRIENGGDYPDRYNHGRRRAERFALIYWPDDLANGETWSVEVRVFGREVTKAGNISKRSTQHWQIHDRAAQTAVLDALVESEIISVDIAQVWYVEHSE